MKDVGFTKDGNRLVEMSQEEYGRLIQLHEAVEGNGLPQIVSTRDYGFRETFDFTKTFGVIYAYCKKRFMINEFQSVLDDMRKDLEKESG